MHRLNFKTILSPAFLQWSFYSPLPPLNFKPKSFSCSATSFQCSPWSGLQTWRESPLNEDRLWGSNGPKSPLLQSHPSEKDDCDCPMSLSASSLAELGALVLATTDPLTKSKLSHLAYSRWHRDNLPIGVSQAPSQPARPLKPQLVCYFSYFLSLKSLIAFKLLGLFETGWCSKILH